jgi:hypothetical protein
MPCSRVTFHTDRNRSSYVSQVLHSHRWSAWHVLLKLQSFMSNANLLCEQSLSRASFHAHYVTTVDAWSFSCSLNSLTSPGIAIHSFSLLVGWFACRSIESLRKNRANQSPKQLRFFFAIDFSFVERIQKDHWFLSSLLEFLLNMAHMLKNTVRSSPLENQLGSSLCFIG